VTEYDILDNCYDLLVSILKERPLNDRLMDIRHMLRATCISLLKLLVVQVPSSPVREGQNDRAREFILL
jgi:hypothetical protein